MALHSLTEMMVLAGVTGLGLLHVAGSPRAGLLVRVVGGEHLADCDLEPLPHDTDGDEFLHVDAL